MKPVKHFQGAFLNASWARVISGELKRLVGSKIAIQPPQNKSGKKGSR